MWICKWINAINSYFLKEISGLKAVALRGQEYSWRGYALHSEYETSNETNLILLSGKKPGLMIINNQYS